MRRKKGLSPARCLIGFGALLAALVFIGSCAHLWVGWAPWEPAQLVSAQGTDGLSAVYWHGLGFFSPVQEGRSFSLPMRNNDFLFTGTENLVIYRSSDGRALAFSGDKAHSVMNGRTVSLQLDQEEAWKWLETASPEEIKGLRLLGIENELNAQQVAQLQEISRFNPGIGLWVAKYETWREISGIFHPTLLMIGDLLKKQELDMLIGMRDIQTLGLHAPGHELEFLSQMAGLETLLIDGWDPAKTGPLPDNLPSLRRLIIIGSSIADLAPLGKQPNLVELNVQEAKSLEDLHLLKQFQNLRLLSLRDTDKVQDLEPLKHLKHMQWLSLPEGTTPEQLAGVIQGLPDLVFLDLSDCKNITDPSPVQNLPDLRYLIVGAGQAKSEALSRMTHLKWLAVAGKDDRVEKKGLENLQETLPDTEVVRLVPFCLGSGWILALLPAMAAAWWMAGRRQRMGRLVHGNHG